MGRVLDRVDGPADVKGLTLTELEQLAAELRQEVIGVVSRTGGHLAANLGSVELTIALCRVFDPPRDKLVWDVGHQAYNYKLLTGRREQFATLRQCGGVAGFLRRSESPYDVWGAGHAGTALSAALGMAAARDVAGEAGKVVAILGDGGLTCGISYEALNNVTEVTRDFIVVLNDNEMSIDRNVGAISRYLNKIMRQPVYNRMKRELETLIRRVPVVGERIFEVMARIEEALKGILVPGILFEELGLRYVGPIDGHDVALLTKTLEFARRHDHPVLVHVLTTKGKGFSLAEEEPTTWHGPGQFDPATGEMLVKEGSPSFSHVFGQAMLRLAEQEPRLVAITAAMPSGTGLADFARAHPRRFYDVGIAEEHAVVFAGGLAAQGLRPCVAIYSTFLQRAFDPIVHDLALQRLPVILALDRAGCVGSDGPTHHGMFDLGYLRLVPHLVVMQPKDEDELVDMLATCLAYDKGPIAVRYPRGEGRGVPIKAAPQLLPIGKAERLAAGDDLSVWALGNMVADALAVAERLAAQGIAAEVVNARFVKPLDLELLGRSLRRTRLVVTLEDHALNCGFGSAVLEAMNELGMPGRLLRFGWPDRFVEHGLVQELRAQHGLDVDSIVERVMAAYERAAGRRPEPLAALATAACAVHDGVAAAPR